MSELTLTVIRLGLLVLLWLFVFSVVGVLRGDLYGTRVVSRRPRARSHERDAAQQPVRAAPPPAPATAPASAQTHAPAPAAKPSRSAARRIPTSLTVTEGSLRGTTVALRESGVLLGRNPECTLVLDDDFASGRHARVFARDGRWLVEDLGSTNGTYLGTSQGTTRLTEPTPVEAGSILRIGRTVIELRK